MARPLAAYFNYGKPANRSGRPKTVSTAAGVREEAAERPTSQLDAVVCLGYRFLAYVGVVVASLAIYIVASFLRRWTGLNGLFVPVMAVTAFTGMFGVVSALVYLVRLAVANFVGWRGFPASTHKLSTKHHDDEERHRREVLSRRGPSWIIRWLSLPSHLDAVAALLWAILFAQLIVADIPH